MIKRKRKKCLGCEKLNYIHARGLCTYCYAMEQREKKLAKLKSPSKEPNEVKKRPRSDTRKVKRKPKLSNKKKKTLSRQKSITFLKNKLWKIFSRYVRLRDAGDNGYCKCFTCDKVLYWKEAQAGHFMSRRFANTFIDEKNVHAQCAHCNLYLSGAQYVYGKHLDSLYGKGTADEVVRLSKQEKKFTPDELNNLMAYYTREVKILLEKKGITT